MKNGIKELTVILMLSGLSLVGGVAFAVEWEMLDRFTVDGYSQFRSSVDIHSNSFTVGGSSFVVQYGQVGVGTSNPSALLHISSTAGVSGDLIVISTGGSNVIRMTGAGDIYANMFHGDISGAAGGAPPTGAAGGGLSGTYPNPGLATSQTAAVAWSGAQTFNGGASFPGSGIWNTSGNVGIGTTAPEYPLSIISGAAGKSYGDLEIKDTGTDGPFLSFHDPGSKAWSVGITNGVGDLSFRENQIAGAAVMTLQHGGNVGIGTTNPANRLVVKGTGILYNTSPVWITNGGAATDGLAIGDNGLNSYKTIDTYGGSLYLNITAGNGVSIGGNVGIGTTSPASKLDVNGRITLGDTGAQNVNLGTDGSNSIFEVQLSGGKQWEFRNDGTIWFHNGSTWAQKI